MHTLSMSSPAPALAPSQACAPSAGSDSTGSLHLLNALYAFYQHERSWVHRTRASLELALVQGPLMFNGGPSISIKDEGDVEMMGEEGRGGVKKEEVDGDVKDMSMGGNKEEEMLSGADADEDTPSGSSSGDEPSAAPTDASDISASSLSSSTTIASSSSHATSATSLSSSSSLPSSSSNNIKPEPTSPSLPSSSLSSSTSLRPGLRPRRTALTSLQPTPDSRWLRRKKSFKLSLGPLSQRPPQRPRLVLPLRPSASGNRSYHPSSSSSNSSPSAYNTNSYPCTSSSSSSHPHPHAHPQYNFTGCTHPPPPPPTQTPGGPQEVEPSAQLLQLFGELVESRLESCVRVSRLLQEAPTVVVSAPAYTQIQQESMW